MSKRATTYWLGAVCCAAAFLLFFWVHASNAVAPRDFGLVEGDLVSATGSDDPDIYIVNEHGYKRLFLNPTIFNFYGHLLWENVRSVSAATRDAFITSGLFRNCETNDPKVYGVEVTAEDGGALHWVNVTAEQALAQDPDFFKKTFCINGAEFDWYPKGAEYLSVSEVPAYSREAPPTEETSPPSEEFDPVSYGSPHPKISQTHLSCCNHPYWHKVYRATSQNGISWQKENQLLKDHASVPAILQKDDGSFILYYVDGEIDTMDCSVSSDGITWSGGNCVIYGFTEQKAWDPYVVTLENGFYRMYFYAPGAVPNRIMSALSKDGINWLQEEGARFSHENVLDPVVIKIGGAWRMYAGDMSRPYIVVAESNDGLTFNKTAEFTVGGNVPEVALLDSGQYALYFCRNGIEMVTSQDGLNWSGTRTAVAPSQGVEEIVCDPSVIKDQNGQLLMYYKVQGPPQ